MSKSKQRKQSFYDLGVSDAKAGAAKRFNKKHPHFGKYRHGYESVIKVVD